MLRLKRDRVAKFSIRITTLHTRFQAGFRSQRKGSTFFLGNWVLCGGFPLPSSPMAFLL